MVRSVVKKNPWTVETEGTLRVIVAEGVKKRQMSKRTCQIFRLSVDISALMSDLLCKYINRRDIFTFYF